MKSHFAQFCRGLCPAILLALSLSACGAPEEEAPTLSAAPAEVSSVAQAVGGTLPVECPQDRPILCEARCERSNCARCCQARQTCTATCSQGGLATCRCF